MVRFADTQPARRVRTRKGQRHLPGRWWLATDGRHSGYESWLERDQLMWLDWDRAVTGTASQPFRLRWTTEEGEPRSHVPAGCKCPVRVNPAVFASFLVPPGWPRRAWPRC